MTPAPISTFCQFVSSPCSRDSLRTDVVFLFFRGVMIASTYHCGLISAPQSLKKKEHHLYYKDFAKGINGKRNQYHFNVYPGATAKKLVKHANGWIQCQKGEDGARFRHFRSEIEREISSMFRRYGQNGGIFQKVQTRLLEVRWPSFCRSWERQARRRSEINGTTLPCKLLKSISKANTQ